MACRELCVILPNTSNTVCSVYECVCLHKFHVFNSNYTINIFYELLAVFGMLNINGQRFYQIKIEIGTVQWTKKT